MDNLQKGKVAILIDAENISYRNAKQIMDTMAVKGDVIVREIIADWTKIAKTKFVGSNAKKRVMDREQLIDGWGKEASKHSMTAVQQFSYVKGKNTCDMALTIQAMKILYEKPYVDVFCLVSNDSDFTRLAQELREQNKEVIGMGERGKAIQEFVNAFSEFVYLGEELELENDNDTDSVEVAEVVEVVEEVKVKHVENRPRKEKKPQPQCILEEHQLEVLDKLIEELIEEYDGNAFYSLISESMKKQFSDFVPANYNCKSVSALIDKLMPCLPSYEKHQQPIPNNPNGKVMMLIRKNAK